MKYIIKPKTLKNLSITAAFSLMIIIPCGTSKLCSNVYAKTTTSSTSSTSTSSSTTSSTSTSSSDTSSSSSSLSSSSDTSSCIVSIPDYSDTESTFGVSYQVCIGSDNWRGFSSDGNLSGNIDTTKNVEAFKICLSGNNLPTDAKITYQAHVQHYGWIDAVSNAEVAGLPDDDLRVEAIRVSISGLEGYSVEYRVYVNSIGWQTWKTTENNTDIEDAVMSGTSGKSLGIKAIEIKIIADQTEETSE
jgi:hypothetical protein